MPLALFAGGCATVPATRGTRLDSKKRIYLKDLCDRYAIAWQWDHIAQRVDLKLNGTDVRLLAGSNVLLLGKEEIRLNAPVIIDQSSVMLPYDFKLKVMDRFEAQFSGRGGRKPARGLKRLREIILDPGHGGKDPGAMGVAGVQEKTVVLDVALRLKKLLEAAGFKVLMTRDDDIFISLEERTVIASRSRADLFVSIHANSNPARSVYGVESYSLRDLGTLEKNEECRQKNHKLMFRNMGMKSGSLILEDIVEDMLYTHKQSVSPDIAQELARKTAQTAKTGDRGERQARFFVLRNTLVPAVLVEIGFVTNPKEGRLLKTSDYRQKIAEGLAKGILGYAQ